MKKPYPEEFPKPIDILRRVEYTVGVNKYVTKTFRSADKGLDKVLGPLEHDVMDVLWATGGATGKEVLAEISRARKIAITTVLTVLERLTGKGLVTKAKGESFYVFTPVHTKDEFAGMVSEEVLKGVIDLSSGSAIASFVDILAEKDPEELDRLSRLITIKKQELKEEEATRQ